MKCATIKINGLNYGGPSAETTDNLPEHYPGASFHTANQCTRNKLLIGVDEPFVCIGDINIRSHLDRVMRAARGKEIELDEVIIKFSEISEISEIQVLY